ncbi:MAG: hypothetical protein OXE96_08935 [Gemmatimonadetes bacterium]|nr:hypothetical protein [Gemmatimonadota bacterium]
MRRGRAPGSPFLLRAAGAALFMAAAVAAAGCEDAGGDTISREQFVEGYVALRVAELRSPGGVIPDDEREAVLAELELIEEDLVAFAETHGGDVGFMEAVWAEVESKLDQLRSQPDTVG